MDAIPLDPGSIVKARDGYDGLRPETRDLIIGP